MKYILWLFLISLTLVGCTEQLPQPTSVSVTVHVSWPAEPNLQALPSNSRSVLVTVASASAPQTILHTLTLNRPQASGTIEAPVGNAIFSAKVYDQVGSQGHLLAHGQVQHQVVIGADNLVNLSFSDLVDRVSLKLANPSLKVGQTTQATASALDAEGAVVIGVGFSWSSSNPSVASIDASGKITALTAGDTLIVASEDRTGKQASATLGVLAVAPPPPGPPVPPPPPGSVERIELGPAKGKLPLRAQIQFLARAFDKNGKLLSGVEFSFSSSNPEVLSLEKRGNAQARGEGQVTIKAEADGKEALASLEVVAASTAPLAAEWTATEPPEYLKGIAGQAKTASGTRLLFVHKAPSFASALFRLNTALNAWVPVYPNISEIDELSTDPLNDNLLVARGGTALYRSNNQGLFWQTTLTDPELAEQPILRNPTNPQVLSTGRFRSADGGQSWTKLDCGLVAQFGYPIRYVFAPQDANKVYCYSNLELRHSGNGGNSWQTMTLPEGVSSVDAFAVNTEGTLYLAGYHNSGTARTFRLSGNGPNWTNGGDLTGGYGFFAFAPSDPNALYLHGGDALTLSKNGGASWTTPLLTGEFQPDFSERSLKVDPNNASILYTFQRSLTNPVFVLRSSDGGATWLSTNIQTDLVTSLPIYFDGNITYVFGIDGLWASSNKGVGFSRLGQNKGLTLHTSMAGWNDASNANRLFNASFSGISQSNDGGQNWSVFDNRSGSLVQAPGTPSVWFGTNARGDVLKSSDAGQSWNWVGRVPFVQPDGSLLKLAVDLNNAELVYAAGLGGIYRSSDGGATWQWASRGLERVVTGDLLLGNNVLYAATREGVYKSIDGAQNWSSINVGLRNLNITQLALASDGTVFAGATDGGVYRSLDANTWEWVSEDLTSYRIQDLATDPSDPNVLYAATIGGIYKSINKGNNWLRASKGLTSPFVNWIKVSPDGQTLYLGTADQGVFKGQPAPAEGADFRTQSVLELHILEQSRRSR